MEGTWHGACIHIGLLLEEATARLGELEIARYRHACTGKKCKYASDISCARIFECTRRAKSLLPDVTHVMNFTRLPHFVHASLKNWKEPGYKARAP